MKKYGEEEDAEGGGTGIREARELLWPTWILALFFLHSLHSISLILLFLPPSLSCLAPSLSLVFLALAGHAAAAELFGSLGFMVAALPLSNDGLVNSDLHWCGETFPYAQFALCI